MNTVTITIKKQPDLYLEADCFTPDALAGKNVDEIAELPVFIGKTVEKI